MIRFRCRCGKGLAVPEAAAGGDVQCPNCGVLQSVPELTDLRAIDVDGTFRFAEESTHATAGSRQRPIDVPSPRDPRGTDRHQTMEEILSVGLPLEAPSKPRPKRYDPETGELVREFDLAEPKDWISPLPEGLEVLEAPAAPAQMHARGVAPGGLGAPAFFAPETARVEAPANAPPTPQAPPTLGYAAGHADYARLVAGQPPIPLKVRTVYWYTIPFELLQTANVLVIAFVFASHLIIQLLCILTLVGMIPLIVLAGWLWLIVLAHYVTVIDETGPERRDEIPSVMRNVSLSEDFLTPLWALVVALAICFGPAALVSREALAWALDGMVYGAPVGGWANPPSGPWVPVGLGLAAIGLLFFPATLLTSAASGTYVNLAPHRIFGVIRAAPLKYALSLLVLMATLVAYPIALSAIGYLTLAIPNWIPSTGTSRLIAAAVAYPSLFIAVYCAHWFAWLLGKIHQEHLDDFGWVWQRHISTRYDPVKRLERQKAAQLLAERDEKIRQAGEQVRTRLRVRH